MTPKRTYIDYLRDIRASRPRFASGTRTCPGLKWQGHVTS